MRNLIGLLVLGMLGLSSTLAHTATLESPAPGANVSGLGYIAGWKCHHGEVTVRIDGGGPIRMATRMPRADTQSVCQGATDNGFITQFNWAFLDDGSHTVAAYDNGVEFARSTFTVATFGEEFVVGAQGECTIADFPSTGETAHFRWNESTQHPELADGIIPPNGTETMGDTFRDTLSSGGQGPEMVVIPAGSFRMGCLNNDGDCAPDEFPVHTVNVPRFALSKYEVTFEQWDACVAAGGCNGDRPNDEGWGRGDRPVIHMSWSDAQSYVSWLSQQTGREYRLPSEAEWEYAARAGTETKYHWGNEIGVNRANCTGCGSQWDGRQTAPVGSFAPNAWGLHDMHGNVLEWTEDCWNSSYRGAPTDGSAWLSGACGRPVNRGSGWSNHPHHLRVADRSFDNTSCLGNCNGFRVARALDAEDDDGQEHLHGRSGEVRVNIEWDADVDLDLYVTNPCGQTFGYSEQTTATCQGTQGEWDYDDQGDGYRNDDPHAENIVWGSPAPQGELPRRA